MPNKSPADTPPAADSPAPVVVRRISNPRPRKAPAKPAPDPAPATEEPVATVPPPPDESPTPLPDTAPAASHEAPPSTGDDWPEPDAPNTPGQDPNKRKRRRRKGKGQGQQANAQLQTNPPSEEIFTLGETTPTAAADAPKPHRPPVAPPRPPAPRPRLDPETLATKAWKIYLAEVSEEGVALVSDQDARELARRCFRLAEIFIEEQSRRLQA